MKQRRPHPRRAGQGWQPRALFAQPGRDFYRLPELELRGGCVLTDGCRKVLDFTPQKICLDMGNLIVTLYGEELRIESLNGKRLVAAGHIRRMEFTGKWEGQHETL